MYNLDTGQGTPVLHLKKACEFEIPFVIKGRRLSEIAEYYCDPPTEEIKLKGAGFVELAERTCR